MPNIFTTGPIADEERQQQHLYSPLSPQPLSSPGASPHPSSASPRKPAPSHDSLHDYLEGRRPYRRTQTASQTLKRWLIGPPILLLCISLVVGLAWLVFSRVYKENPFTQKAAL